MHRTRLAFLISAIAFLSLAQPSAGQGAQIGFEETFALAPDSSVAIEQLIPGTQDFYYYACLERQHAGRYDQVPALLKTWVERHGRNGRVEEIENRQALLTYAKSPERTFKFLHQRLGLRFDHEQVLPGARPNLPTVLDEAAISVRR
jgi:hypothetical protein